jgi:L,D-transpeptidase YbiS
MRLWDGYRLVQEWDISTSKFGLGFVEGSNCTPLGAFVVAEKHGADAPLHTIFKARQAMGEWQGSGTETEDLVLTRILRLAGAESKNANTYERYIYIHGTNDERRIGQRSSHGCIRMRNEEIIDLFGRIPVGTPVWISE